MAPSLCSFVEIVTVFLIEFITPFFTEFLNKVARLFTKLWVDRGGQEISMRVESLLNGMDEIEINTRSDTAVDLLQNLRQSFVPRSHLDAATEEIRRLKVVIRELQLRGQSGEAPDDSTETRTPIKKHPKSISDFEPTIATKSPLPFSCSFDLCPTITADKDEVSVLFADVVGFTAMSAAMDASRVADMLRRLFVCLDDLALAYGVQPVDVIGDAYLAAANLDTPCLDHAARLARFAVAAVAAAHTVPVDPAGHSGGHLRIRVGLHCGPVAVAVLSRAGGKRSLIGDTVNTASRMESTGRPDQVQCSGEMAQLLAEQAPELALRPRKGGVVAKGKGRLETFWVGPHPLELAGRQGPGGSFRVQCAAGSDCGEDGDGGVRSCGGSFRSESSFGGSFRGSIVGSYGRSFRGSIGGMFGGSFRGSFRSSFGRSDSLVGGGSSRASSAATGAGSDARC